MPIDSRALDPAAIDSLVNDIDIQTALALTRANSRAMAALSPDSRRQIITAIGDEIRIQETLDDPVARIVATLLKGHLTELG